MEQQPNEYFSIDKIVLTESHFIQTKQQSSKTGLIDLNTHYSIEDNKANVVLTVEFVADNYKLKATMVSYCIVTMPMDKAIPFLELVIPGHIFAFMRSYVCNTFALAGIQTAMMQPFNFIAYDKQKNKVLS